MGVRRNIVGYRTMRHLIEYKNPVDIDRELKAYRNANGCITPELAMDYLNKTNHVVNMRFIARNISSLDEKEWIKYKDFVLEAIEGRNQCDEVFNIFVNMAKKGNYLEQFVSNHQKPKVYGINDKVILSEDSNFSRDLSGYDILITTCDYANFMREAVLPKVVIFRNMNLLNLRRANCKNNMELLFIRDDGKLGNSIYIYDCKNLPKCLDVSSFKDVDLSHSDLSNVEELKLGKHEILTMIGAKNFPEKLDLSDVKTLCLDDCDFNGTKEIIFGATKKLDLSGAFNLPSRLDFTQCEKLVLDGCDFAGVGTIYIKDEEQAYLIKDGINSENVDVFVGARKDPFDMNRITNSLLFLPKRKHIWDK